ncbi:MAG: hypothetical protein WAN35_01590 [Terracidiphilus sp.]
MLVLSVHEREFSASHTAVGALIDTLASSNDRMWPLGKWPPMHFDRSLAVGAAGGHGPVHYSVEEYQPSNRIVFSFSAPRGFNGTHRFEIEERQGKTVLRHVIEMCAEGPALLSWPLIFRPLHDACLEDCLDRATLCLGIALTHPARWSPYVRLLRAVMRAVSRPARR